MILKAIIGAGLGLAMEPLCRWTAEKLLKARGKELSESKKERLLLCAILAVYGGVAFTVSGFSPEGLYLLLMGFLSAALAVTDIHQRLIPNELVLAIIVLSLLFGIPAQLGLSGFPAFGIIQSLTGLAACFFIFTLPALLHKNVGAGDVKLAAAMGFALGFENSIIAIVLMGCLILGSCFLQKSMPAVKYLKTQIPMGPFLSAAMAVILVYTRMTPL